MIQVICMYAQEIIALYVIGRSGDYAAMDTLGMANFLIFLGVYGTAIIFNQTIETLVSHAYATKKFELTGHILNRAMFLWLFLFGALFAGMYNIDIIIEMGLEWDEDDA